MTRKVEFICFPSGIGSMPQTDAGDACRQVLRWFPDVPFWPQLPRRSYRENMYIQYSEGFPGIDVDPAGERIRVDVGRIAETQVTQLDADAAANDFKKYVTSRDYAAGLHSFVDMKPGRAAVVKGQITGPISWGLSVADQAGKPVVYDDSLSEMLARFLRLKAAWQENLLRTVNPRTLVFLDEPYMASLGSAFVSIPRERVVELLSSVLSGIQQYRGIHCCGNTDWSVFLDLPIDVLSFDAFNYSQALSLYADKVKDFLARGGNLAWGIVPNDEVNLAKETVSSLGDRLEAGMALLSRKGIRSQDLVSRALLTPSCGLSGVSNEAVTAAFMMLTELSSKLRKKYNL